MADASDAERELTEGFGVCGLHAIATRALAHRDHYARALFRTQLEEEEFSESSNVTPGTE
jgi:hypothetical protein